MRCDVCGVKLKPACAGTCFENGDTIYDSDQDAVIGMCFQCCIEHSKKFEIVDAPCGKHCHIFVRDDRGIE